MVAGFPSSIRVRRARAIGRAFWVAVLGGMIAFACGGLLPAAPPVDLPSVRIAGVPHVRQKPDFCGEACVEMYLRKLKVRIDQDDVFGESGVDPAQGRGCYTSDLARAVKNIGFKAGAVWYSIPTQDAWSRLNDEFATMHADLQAGVPSIVCM